MLQKKSENLLILRKKPDLSTSNSLYDGAIEKNYGHVHQVHLCLALVLLSTTRTEPKPTLNPKHNFLLSMLVDDE